MTAKFRFLLLLFWLDVRVAIFLFLVSELVTEWTLLSRDFAVTVQGNPDKATAIAVGTIVHSLSPM